MTDTVTKLMELADEYAVLRANWDSGHTSQTTPHLVDKARQALQDELTRLFTPLTDEQIEKINFVDLKRLCYEVFEVDQESVTDLVRSVESLHGITGESK